MKSSKVDPDNDRGYQAPRAWRDLKAVARKIGNGLPELLLEIEKIDGLCPRVALAIAAHHFMRSDESSRAIMLHDYFNWFGRLDRPDTPKAFAEVVSIALSPDVAKRVRWLIMQGDSKRSVIQFVAEAVGALLGDAPPAEKLNEDGTLKKDLPESLPAGERESLEAEFEAVMRRIMGDAA